jgi:hypothetical protein
MTQKYRMAKNIPKLSTQWPSKTYQNWDLGFQNIPSEDPVWLSGKVSGNVKKYTRSQRPVFKKTHRRQLCV